MSSKAPHLAIAGFGNADDVSSGVSIAQALRDGLGSGIEVTALIDPGMMTSAWQPGLADHMRRRPQQASSDQQLFEWLTAVHRDRALEGIVPCTQSWLTSIANLAPRLAREGVATLVPSPDRVKLLSRSHLPKFLYEQGMVGPLSVFVSNTNDVAACAHQLGFPLMVKGDRHGCRPVHSPEQAQQVTGALNGAAGAGVLLQREMAGQVIDVATVVDRNGHLAALVAMRRVASDERGRAICGAVVDDPEITTCIVQLVDALDWCGPLEVTLLKPGGSGELQILDARGGLPSWSRLTGWAGCNLGVRMLQELLGESPAKSPRPKAGTLFVRGVSETTVPFGAMARLDRHGAEEGIAASTDTHSVANREVNGAKRLRVAVTGISTFDVINPGLGVARALRESEDVSTLIGLGYGNFDSGAYSSDLFDAAFRLPASDDASQLLDRLKAVYRECPFEILVPCLDGELERFLEIREELQAMGVSTLLPEKVALEKRSKLRLFGPRTRRDWGAFQIPESRIVKSEKGLLKAVSELGMPCVVKGPISHCHVAHTEGDAKAAWQQIRRTGSSEAIVQVHIPGACFAIATICDATHRTLSSLTVKKLAICERGSTWSAVYSPQPALEDAFADFLEHIGWTGAAEGEFIRDELRDRFYLIEVNPRFTAWIYFTAALGSNHPDLLVRTAAGLPSKPENIPDEDLVFVRGTLEIPVGAASLAALSMKGAVYHGKA